MLGQVQPGVNEQALLGHSKGRPDASEETMLDQIGLVFDLLMTLQHYSCMPALVPQLPEFRDAFPNIQDTPPLLSLLHCSEDQIVNHFSRRNGSSLLQYIPPRGSSSSLSGNPQGNVCSRESCSDAPLPHVLSHTLY